MLTADPKDRLIVALDVDTLGGAVGLVERLAGLVRRFKIGSQLFTASGPAAVEAVRRRGGEVFLDLKYHDIPNTAAGAARDKRQVGAHLLVLIEIGLKHLRGELVHERRGDRTHDYSQLLTSAHMGAPPRTAPREPPTLSRPRRRGR